MLMIYSRSQALSTLYGEDLETDATNSELSVDLNDYTYDEGYHAVVLDIEQFKMLDLLEREGKLPEGIRLSGI